MDLYSIALIMGGLLLYSLISGRLQGTIITAPMVFIIFGFIVGTGGLNIMKINLGHAPIHFVAEFTLILVLFTDAARINLTLLRHDHNLPVRMLIIGLPLVIAAGTSIALVLFPDFSIWEAALLAALLAPTDAALGQAVVSTKSVPVRIRQAINVESGLNDGITLPAVLLFATLASAEYDASEASEWIRFGLLQLTLGPLTGMVMGWAGARLLDTAAEHDWINLSFQGIGILALAIFTYVSAELIGGNGFITAFIGGMVFSNTLRHPCTFLLEFMETDGAASDADCFPGLRCRAAVGRNRECAPDHISVRRIESDDYTHDSYLNITLVYRFTATLSTFSRLVRAEGTGINIVCTSHCSRNLKFCIATNCSRLPLSQRR